MMQIIVIYGGNSNEREVSLRSGERVAEALRCRGHRVACYDHVGGKLPIGFLQAAFAADALFLALHGGEGENGCLQARLTSCGIWHYTGSCPAGSAMAMAKSVARNLVAQAGIPVADGCLLKSDRAAPPFAFPLVVKPETGGSSIGMHIVKTPEEWQKLTPLRGMLCEKYLPGREFTVGVLNGRALPVVEICPHGGVYDYRHKYRPGESRERCPAPISDMRAGRMQEMAQRIFGILGLRDYARMDFREDADGIPCFLEANTLPGMTETSLFPLAAEAAGIPFAELCEKMAAMAAKRKRNRG